MNEQIISMISELIKAGGTEAVKVILILKGFEFAIHFLGFTTLIMIAKLLTESITRCNLPAKLDEFSGSELYNALAKRANWRIEISELKEKLLKEANKNE